VITKLLGSQVIPACAGMTFVVKQKVPYTLHFRDALLIGNTIGSSNPRILSDTKGSKANLISTKGKIGRA